MTKGDYPLDANAAKKIRANIIDGRREQARGYYFLDDWVLKAIEEDELFPQAQPDLCTDCNNGVIVYSISSCQSCYHCSNESCARRGCANNITASVHPTRVKLGLHPEQSLEIIVCDKCRDNPLNPVKIFALCGACKYNRKMAYLLDVPFLNYPSEVFNE